MPDKMMRNAGLGDDGTAKAIRTDNDGHLDVISQSKRDYEVVTLYEGLAEPEENILMRIPWENQSETWVAVETDKPSWELARRSNVWGGGSSYTTGFYPRRDNEQRSYSIDFPAQSLVLPRISPREVEDGYLLPTNILEAKALSEMVVGDIRIRFRNNNEETATIKIQALKIWR